MPVDKLYFVSGVPVVLCYDTLVDFVNDKTRDAYTEYMLKRQRSRKCECLSSCKHTLEQPLRDLLWEIVHTDFVTDAARDMHAKYMEKRQHSRKCDCPCSCKFQLEQALRDLLWAIVYSDEDHFHTLDRKDEYDQDCPHYEEPHIHCILGVKTDELDFTKPETTHLGVPWKGSINTTADAEEWDQLVEKYPILEGQEPKQFMTSYCYDDH